MALNLKCAAVLPASARILLLLVLALAAAMPPAEGAQVDDATAMPWRSRRVTSPLIPQNQNFPRHGLARRF